MLMIAGGVFVLFVLLRHVRINTTTTYPTTTTTSKTVVYRNPPPPPPYYYNPGNPHYNSYKAQYYN